MKCGGAGLMSLHEGTGYWQLSRPAQSIKITPHLEKIDIRVLPTDIIHDFHIEQVPS